MQRDTRHTASLFIVGLLAVGLGIFGLGTPSLQAGEPAGGPPAETSNQQGAENAEFAPATEPAAADSGYVIGRYLIPAVIFALLITTVAIVVQRSNDARSAKG